MKKIVVMGICLVFLTGCGSGKKLICTEERDTYKEEITINFDKSGDKIKTYVMKYSVEYTDNSELEDDYGYAVEYCKEYEEKVRSGYKCSVSKNGKMLVQTIDVNVSKLTDEYRKELDKEVGTYSKAKKEFEGMGYTCK